jgi:hypothetical protein
VTAFGYGYAAVRLHIVSIWPLALLHALDDFLQLNSPDALPWPFQLLVAAGFVLYGRYLLRTACPERDRAHPGGEIRPRWG